MELLKKNSLFYSSSVEETYAFAAAVMAAIEGRGIISLEGPLGAGKTHFVKGAAVALELQDEVTSPTFTLLQSYGKKNKRLHHVDFYRLNSEVEALDLGLQDYFAEGLMIIEWGNKFPNILPEETIRIVITPLKNDARKIELFVPESRY